MPLHTKNPRARERILSFGAAGVGKSHDAYTIASLLEKTGSDAKFYVLDIDVNTYSMLADPLFERLSDSSGNPVPRLVIEDDVYDWDTMMAALERCQRKMRPHDWLLIDMMSPAWSWVQSAFTEKVFHGDLGEYFLQKRAAMKDAKKERMFEGWTDWPVINAMYKQFADRVLRGPGNLYCTAEAKAISTDQAEKDTKIMLGPYGVVPVGQKRDPYLFRTVIIKTRGAKDGVYEAITVKDRGRPDMNGAQIKDFAMDYLVKRAGWGLGSLPEGREG